MTEFKLFDTPGAEVAQITTDGETFKPFLNAIDYVVDEARLHVSEDGLSVIAVDAANVFMIDIELEASVFEEYELNTESVLGINIGALKSLVRRARKNSDDELTLSLRERELTATVSRGYDNHNVVSQGSLDLIDPDSIRDEPSRPDLDTKIRLDVDIDPLADAISYATSENDHVQFSVKGVNQHTNALYIGGESAIRRESVAIDGIKSPDTAESLYSSDYVADILAGVKHVDPDEVQLRFADEYPMLLSMESADASLTLDYIVSPRITSD